MELEVYLFIVYSPAGTKMKPSFFSKRYIYIYNIIGAPFCKPKGAEFLGVYKAPEGMFLGGDTNLKYRITFLFIELGLPATCGWLIGPGVTFMVIKIPSGRIHFGTLHPDHVIARQ